MLVLTTCVAVLVLAGVTGIVLIRHAFDDSARQYLSTDGWPATGQGAYQIGDDTPRASADQQPVPIASVAKVMTAMVVLADLPLHGAESGPTFVVSQRDVADTAARRAREESVVPLRAGERLTERQALLAMLLPSANNVAVLLARAVSGSVAAFVAEMNRTAHGLGMQHTKYTDPSGFDPATVSTATDQLLLAEAAAKDATLTTLMGTRSYRLPVAGLVQNTDTLLGTGGFVGMKTGSDDAAGGCFMFRAYRSVRGFNVQVIGVVLGQQGHRLIDAALYAAKQLVDRVAPQPAHA
jgi:D-alanyl-D-alanine carboxypeptidase (penicillin-binding protein 5/6)